MKYRVILFILPALFISSSFAQQLMLELSATQVDINQGFSLTVTAQEIPYPWTVEIQGMEPFVVQGQSSATNVVMVNGVSRSQAQLQLQMQASSTGSFVIGPARIQTTSGPVESTTVSVNVIGEKLFINPQSVVDLSGIATKKATEPFSSSFPRQKKKYRPWLLLVLCVGGIVLLDRRGYLGRFWQNISGDPTSKKLQQTENITSIQIKLPRSNASAFRDKLDQRSRDWFLLQGIQDAHGLTVQELIIVSSTLFCEEDVLCITQLIQTIQQAKYAGTDLDRQEVLQLAKQVMKIKGR